MGWGQNLGHGLSRLPKNLRCGSTRTHKGRGRRRSRRDKKCRAASFRLALPFLPCAVPLLGPPTVSSGHIPPFLQMTAREVPSQIGRVTYLFVPECRAQIANSGKGNDLIAREFRRARCLEPYMCLYAAVLRHQQACPPPWRACDNRGGEQHSWYADKQRQQLPPPAVNDPPQTAEGGTNSLDQQHGLHRLLAFSLSLSHSLSARLFLMRGSRNRPGNRHAPTRALSPLLPLLPAQTL